MWEVFIAAALARLAERLVDQFYPSPRQIPPREYVAVLPVREPLMPANFYDLLLRGTSSWYEGRFVEAIDDFSAYLRENPSSAEALNNRGQVFADLGYATLALQDLSKALTLIKSDRLSAAYAKSARGYAFGVLGQLSHANQDFTESLRVAPKNAWTFFRRGLLYYRLGQTQLARDSFSDALRLVDPPLTDVMRRQAAEMIEELRS